MINKPEKEKKQILVALLNFLQLLINITLNVLFLGKKILNAEFVLML